MPDNVDRALAAPSDTELVFTSEQVPQLYIASTLLIAAGAISLITYFTAAAPITLDRHLIAAVGVVFLLAGAVLLSTTRAGFPRLTLRGNRLTLHHGFGNETLLDLAALGTAEIVRVVTHRKNRVYLGFRSRAGEYALRARGDYQPPAFSDLHKSILLNGLVPVAGTAADEVADVVNARRLPGAPPLSEAEIAVRRRATRRRTFLFFAACLALLAVVIVVRLLI